MYNLKTFAVIHKIFYSLQKMNHGPKGTITIFLGILSPTFCLNGTIWWAQYNVHTHTIALCTIQWALAAFTADIWYLPCHMFLVNLVFICKSNDILFVKARPIIWIININYNTIFTVKFRLLLEYFTNF